MQGLSAILLMLFFETTYPGDKLTLTSTTKYALSATPLSTTSETAQLKHRMSHLIRICHELTRQYVLSTAVRMLAGP